MPPLSTLLIPLKDKIRENQDKIESSPHLFFEFDLEKYWAVLFKFEIYKSESLKKEFTSKLKFEPLIGELVKFEFKINSDSNMKGQAYFFSKEDLVEKKENFFLLKTSGSNLEEKEIQKVPVILENRICFFLSAEQKTQAVYLGNFI